MRWQGSVVVLALVTAGAVRAYGQPRSGGGTVSFDAGTDASDAGTDASDAGADAHDEAPGRWPGRYNVSAVGAVGTTLGEAVEMQRVGVSAGVRVTPSVELEGTLSYLRMQQRLEHRERRDARGMGAQLLALYELGEVSQRVRVGVFGGVAGSHLFWQRTGASAGGGSESDWVFSIPVGLQVRRGEEFLWWSLRVGAELWPRLGPNDSVAGLMFVELRPGAHGGAVVRPQEPDELEEHTRAYSDLRGHLRAELRDLFSDATEPSPQGLRADFRTRWEALTVQRIGSSQSSVWSNDLAPGRCLLIAAQGTPQEPRQDLDLRIRHGDTTLMEDVSTDDWPVVMACNFTGAAQTLTVEGRYVGASEVTSTGYAAITWQDIAMPDWAPQQATEPPSTMLLQECGDQPAIDYWRCGLHLPANGERTFTLPNGGRFCASAPEVSQVRLTIAHAVAGSQQGPTRSQVLRWHGSVCTEVPVDQGAWRVTVKAEGIGGPVVLAHQPAAAAVERLQRQMLSALETNAAALTGPSPTAAYGMAWDGNPLGSEPLSVPAFGRLRVQALTQTRQSGTLQMRVVPIPSERAPTQSGDPLQESSSEAPTTVADALALRPVQRMVWGNDGAAVRSVTVRVSPRLRDRTALVATVQRPEWRLGERAVSRSADDTTACREALPAAGQSCRLEPGAARRLNVRAGIGPLCLAAQEAPVVNSGQSSERTAPFWSLAGNTAANTPAGCVEVSRSAYTVQATTPTLVFVPPPAPRQPRRGR